MKKYFFAFITVIIVVSFTKAQDPAISGAIIDPIPYVEGGTGTATFVFRSSNGVMPAATGLTVTVSFLGALPVGPPTGAGAALFNWVGAGNNYQGTQNSAIQPFSAIDPSLPIVFQVNVVGVAGQTGGFNVNLQNVPDNNENDNDQTSDSAPIAADNPLYVELLSFTGKRINQSHHLEWITTFEQNNSGFEIQRSLDGQRWEKIGWVEGNGNADREIRYNFVDKNPRFGNNYYQLKQIDFDGKYDFSNIIILNYQTEKPEIQVTPNPSVGDFIVNISNPKKEDLRIKLLSTSGQLIWQSDTLQGMEEWRREFSLKQKENIFVNAIIGNHILTQKVIINAEN